MRKSIVFVSMMVIFVAIGCKEEAKSPKGTAKVAKVVKNVQNGEIRGECTDGVDNDGDKLTDCEDPDCAKERYCGPGGQSPCDKVHCGTEEAIWKCPLKCGRCGDGICADNESLCDCMEDCGTISAPVYASLCGKEDCYDGVDNDGDKLADCEDPDCVGKVYCKSVKMKESEAAKTPTRKKRVE